MQAQRLEWRAGVRLRGRDDFEVLQVVVCMYAHAPLLVLRLHLTLGSRMTESIVVAWVRIRCANAMDAVNQVPSLFV